VALRNASNDDRAGAIGDLLQHKPSGAHAPPESGLAALDPVSIGRLDNNEDFRALKAELEGVPTGAPIKLAGVLAKSKSAAGARFLALGAAGLPSEVFKDLEAGRALASMDGALRAALAVDRNGTKRAEWNVVAKGLAKTLISGNWGKLDLYYDVAAPILRIRDGNINIDNAAGKPFWVNQTQLEDARRPIIAAMAFIGYDGTDENSFAAFYFYASILSRAKDLALLPSDEHRRPYLCKALQSAAVSAIAGAAEQHALMLLAPPYLAARPTAFVPEGSAAMVKLAQFDDDFRYTHDKIRRSARMGASSSSDATSSRPAKPTHHAATSSVWDTDPSSKRQKAQTQPWDQNGERAQQEGIWRTQWGIAFGSKFHIVVEETALNSVQCYAALYNAGSTSPHLPQSRMKWCFEGPCTPGAHHTPSWATGCTVTWLNSDSAEAVKIKSSAGSWTKLVGCDGLTPPVFPPAWPTASPPIANPFAGMAGGGKGGSKGKSKGKGKGRGGWGRGGCGQSEN